MPNSTKADNISRTLEKTDIKVAMNTGVKIQDILGRKEAKNDSSEAKSVVGI